MLYKHEKVTYIDVTMGLLDMLISGLANTLTSFVGGCVNLSIWEPCYILQIHKTDAWHHPTYSQTKIKNIDLRGKQESRVHIFPCWKISYLFEMVILPNKDI